jgi:hypothetical protein
VEALCGRYKSQYAPIIIREIQMNVESVITSNMIFSGPRFWLFVWPWVFGLSQRPKTKVQSPFLDLDVEYLSDD